MKKVLFMGDSITDGGRNRNVTEPNISLGSGYANIAAADIAFRNPGKYAFYNRGVGGQGIKDMYARIREDVIAIEPDYMSILASVNDAWFDLGGKGLPIIDNKKAMERFERTYSMLIDETLDSLPDKDKAIVILKYFEDKTLEEIADILNENISTIKSRLYRSMKKLRDALSNDNRQHSDLLKKK